jgi:serine protease
MRNLKKSLWALCLGWGLGSMFGTAIGAPAEWNPVRTHGAEIGPQANRLIVGFRATPDNAAIKMVKVRARAQAIEITQAQTSKADVVNLALRTGVAVAASRQVTPNMHVMFLPVTLYGADVTAALAQLRADASVEFAEIDQRRYAHSLPPNDPLYSPSANATGQWYMLTPSSLTATSDAAATDAISAWGITQGSTGTVIADVDNGIRFDHPDLLRAGFGGRLLPGYDFVNEDINRTNSAQLGTFLIANDGDGWDPDPTDPGDWVSTADMMNTTVFPPTDCGDPNSSPVDGPTNSSWHGTRVVGVLGAITNNSTGIAGMTWNPYILPVRALGKCGGFDSDIMAGMEWAAGMHLNEVPDNPYPADIINLSLGGAGSCPSGYQSIITQLTQMGVLVVASAGNESGPVDAPGNCAGVLAVAGLRNVGTKVGYSSLGPEVGIGAPAGNCVNTVGACLRSIDTTSNSGTTVPGSSIYTDQNNVNLGTSFSAPIVSGIAALMRAVNANLTPPQLIARIKSSATPYPAPAGVQVCSNTTTSSVECACTTATCGAGMVNALHAVQAAQNPIAAVKLPAGFTTGAAIIDASPSVAACGATMASYVWSNPTGGVAIVSGNPSAQVHVTSTGTAGTLTLTVRDSAGNTDTALIVFSASGANTLAPSAPGSSATACVTAMTVTPAAPTVTAAFSPASVAVNAESTLTMTLTNSNAYVLTQSTLTQALPANLSISASPAPSTTCDGAQLSLANTTSSVTLSNANIPANGSCTITLTVNSATAADYTNTIGVDALMTGPAGGNSAPASAALTVTAAAAAAPASGASHGGGELDWLDILFVVGVLLASRRQAHRRSRT